MCWQEITLNSSSLHSIGLRLSNPISVVIQMNPILGFILFPQGKHELGGSANHVFEDLQTWDVRWFFL